MKSKRPFALALLLLLLLLGPAATTLPAHARPNRTAWSISASALTLLAGMATGGVLLASKSEATCNGGIAVLAAGFSLAPLASQEPAAR